MIEDKITIETAGLTPESRIETKLPTPQEAAASALSEVESEAGQLSREIKELGSEGGGEAKTLKREAQFIARTTEAQIAVIASSQTSEASVPEEKPEPETEAQVVPPPENLPAEETVAEAETELQSIQVGEKTIELPKGIRVDTSKIPAGEEASITQLLENLSRLEPEYRDELIASIETKYPGLISKES